jgi:hypothetical protein
VDAAVVWIVIVLIMVVAFGPLLWLMPTPRERRLASLRQSAYGLGMRVELGRLPSVDPMPEQRVSAGGRALDTTRACAAYLHPLPRRLRHLPPARLLRGDHGVAARPGWSFERGGKPDHPALGRALAAVAATLDAMPEDAVALEWRRHDIGAYWLESPGATVENVQNLAGLLAAAGAALCEVDAGLDAGGDRGNI